MNFEAGKYQQIRLLDVSGKLLQNHRLNHSQDSISIVTANYPKGVYVIELIGNAAHYRIKVLK